MYSKIIAVSVTVLVGSLSLCANTLDESTMQIQKDIAVNITEDISEVITVNTPFEVYKKALANVKEPSYNNLQPLFEDLAVLNATFAKGTTIDNNNLAKYLNQYINVGWNAYRKMNMLEIFHYYFPQENSNNNIALLEYNIKYNLLNSSERAEILMFQNTTDKAAARLNTSYVQFVKILQDAKTYDPKSLVIPFVTLIKESGQSEKAFPGLTALAKESLFIQPILAGWGRTVSVKEIKNRLGIEKDIAGDGINFYSADKLKEMYGLSSQDAELMSKFVREYNINN